MDANEIGHNSTGRTKTVVVFQDGEGKQTFVTSIVCQISDSAEKVRFTGPGIFSEKTQSHIMQTVYPTVESLLSRLGINCPSFILSAVNLGAASWDHRGMVISGFSADAPVFLAMLSATLEVRVCQEVLCTGHIASLDGDIRMVGSLPHKIRAAFSDESIRTFVYPDPTADDSLDPMLSREEIQEVDAALAHAKQSLKLFPVRDVAGLLERAFSDEEWVLAALRKQYFARSIDPLNSESPLERAASFMTRDLQTRFWPAVETRLFAGEGKQAGHLLESYVEFYITRKTYPEGCGENLFSLISSLPPSTRRLKLTFPLLSLARGFDLARYAAASDHKDVAVLVKALNGDVAKDVARTRSLSNKSPDSALHTVVALISEDSLVERINRPIDSARASYSLESVLIQDFETFNDQVISFYIHLIRRVRGAGHLQRTEVLDAEAFDLLERAFSSNGGAKGALLEARMGTRGGMRFVLDAMTERYKKEEREKEVFRVLIEAMDPLDWKSKASFIEALMSSLRAHLPDDVKDQSPERYAGNVPLLAKAYVESMDKLNSVFRSF